jgi:hypothetical protein
MQNGDFAIVVQHKMLTGGVLILVKHPGRNGRVDLLGTEGKVHQGDPRDNRR